MLCQGVQGDVVELGCNRGHTSVLLHYVIQHHDPSRTLHLYDSFYGSILVSLRHVYPTVGRRSGCRPESRGRPIGVPILEYGQRRRVRARFQTLRRSSTGSHLADRDGGPAPTMGCAGAGALVTCVGAALQNVLVSSSATRKIGFPPLEIDTAWATAFCADGDAAAACKASIDGKCSSASL